MRYRNFLISVLLLFVVPIISANAAKVQIDFEYNSVGICQAATATLDNGSLIGKARLEKLVKGDYYLVREIHYSPLTGRVIYEGLSKFAIGIGTKISEERIIGNKVMEIFSTWP